MFLTKVNHPKLLCCMLDIRRYQRWLIYFADIDGNVDRHCLNCLFIKYDRANC